MLTFRLRTSLSHQKLGPSFAYLWSVTRDPNWTQFVATPRVTTLVYNEGNVLWELTQTRTHLRTPPAQSSKSSLSSPNWEAEFEILPHGLAEPFTAAGL